MVKSGILFEPAGTTGAWSHILDVVFHLARRRSSLREECGWILYSAVLALSSKSQSNSYVQLIIDKLHETGLEKTPEGLAIWIAIQSAAPTAITPKGTWHNDDPLDRSEKTKIANILKEASTSDVDQASTISKASQKGNWTPKLHFVWDVILSQLQVPEHTEHVGALKRLSFEEFWGECVDSLFSHSHLAIYLLNSIRESVCELIVR